MSVFAAHKQILIFDQAAGESIGNLPKNIFINNEKSSTMEIKFRASDQRVFDRFLLLFATGLSPARSRVRLGSVDAIHGILPAPCAKSLTFPHITQDFLAANSYGNRLALFASLTKRFYASGRTGNRQARILMSVLYNFLFYY